MEKYLDITKPHCSKNIFPLLWHSVISRFHCIFPQAGLEKGEGVTSRFNTRHFDTMIRTQAVKLHKNFDHFKYSFYVSKQWQIQESGLPTPFLGPSWGLKGWKIFLFKTGPPLSQGLDAPPPPLISGSATGKKMIWLNILHSISQECETIYKSTQ